MARARDRVDRELREIRDRLSLRLCEAARRGELAEELRAMARNSARELASVRSTAKAAAKPRVSRRAKERGVARAPDRSCR